MNTQLFYQQLIPDDIGYLTDRNELVGHYTASTRSLEDLQHAKSFKSALEWFANLPADPSVEDIQAFTKKHGLLRWNWTHEGHSGGPGFDAFYLPLAAFTESQRQFREQWAAASTGKRSAIESAEKWLSAQLAAAPQVASSLSVEASEMWNLTQPRMALEATTKGKGVEVRLVLGDLWQALCCALLEKLGAQHGLVRMCKNDRCKGAKYFISTHGRQRFCDNGCAKAKAGREHMRRKRARLRRAGAL